MSDVFNGIQSNHSSSANVLLRIVWMFAGYMFLAIDAMMIYRHDGAMVSRTSPEISARPPIGRVS